MEVFPRRPGDHPRHAKRLGCCYIMPVSQVHPLVATLICADLVDREFVARARERGAFNVLFRPIELDRLRTSIRTAHEVTFERRLWLSAREQESRSGEHSNPGFRLETVK